MSNLFWRSFYRESQNYIQKKSSLYTGGLHTCIQSINKLRQEFGYINYTQIFLLFDNTVSTLELRKILSEGEYKSHRLTKKAKEFLYKDLEYLKEILKHYDDSFRVVWKEGCEADDLVKPVLDTLDINKDKMCLLVSVDMDWSRSTSDYIHWYNYSEVVGRDFFKKKYGFDPKGKNVQLYKAIRGDSSDGIKSAVKNIPEKIVIDIIENFKDVDDLMRNLWETDYSDKWKRKIQENEAQLRLNYRLVDFIDIEENIKECIYVSKENNKKLEFLYNGRGIPLEERMVNPVKKRNTFLKRK